MKEAKPAAVFLLLLHSDGRSPSVATTRPSFCPSFQQLLPRTPAPPSKPVVRAATLRAAIDVESGVFLLSLRSPPRNISHSSRDPCGRTVASKDTRAPPTHPLRPTHYYSLSTAQPHPFTFSTAVSVSYRPPILPFLTSLSTETAHILQNG